MIVLAHEARTYREGLSPRIIRIIIISRFIGHFLKIVFLCRPYLRKGECPIFLLSVRLIALCLCLLDEFLYVGF